MTRRSIRSEAPDDNPGSLGGGLDALFREQYPRLCEFVHGYVRSRDAAQDIVQDLFLALWRKYPDARAGELTNAYLYTAARNRALKYLRHGRVAQRFQERSRHADESSRADTDHAVREREIAQAVDRAIAELPDRCREIFLLSRRQQMTNAEIAATLGISVKTVEVQMWRALRKLRDRLAPYLTVAVAILL